MDNNNGTTDTDTNSQTDIDTVESSTVDFTKNNSSKAQKTKTQKTKASKNKAKKKKGLLPNWLRITLKILRVFLVPVLCIIAVFGGMIIGYVYIGDQELADVFQFETWRHLYDLVFKDSVDS